MRMPLAPSSSKPIPTQIPPRRAKKGRSPASSSCTLRLSEMFVGVTLSARSSPEVSTSRCRLRPDAFGRIVALVGARFLGDADTLAVHDRRRNLRIPALLLPGGPAQSYEDVLPDAVQTPSPKPIVRGTPR